METRNNKPTLNISEETAMKAISNNIAGTMNGINSKYRIVEQYGVFRIQQKIVEQLMSTPIDLLLCIFWNPKEVKEVTYWVSAYNKPFSTIEEAKDFIPKLEAKYHEL